MGTFDTFIGLCPSCGNRFTSQTKLTACELKTLQEGSTVELRDCKLEVKDKCKSCGFNPVVIIENGRVITFTKDAPTMRESLWGNIIPLDCDRETATKKISKDFMAGVIALVKHQRQHEGK